jgi:hypothetical protein
MAVQDSLHSLLDYECLLIYCDEWKITAHCSGNMLTEPYKNLRGFSPQANYTDRVTVACWRLVPTFADRGCRVVSLMDHHGH